MNRYEIETGEELPRSPLRRCPRSIIHVPTRTPRIPHFACSDLLVGSEYRCREPRRGATDSPLLFPCALRRQNASVERGVFGLFERPATRKMLVSTSSMDAEVVPCATAVSPRARAGGKVSREFLGRTVSARSGFPVFLAVFCSVSVLAFLVLAEEQKDEFPRRELDESVLRARVRRK